MAKILKSLEKELLKKIDPHLLDCDPKSLKKALQLLGKRHLLALFPPKKYGGLEWDEDKNFEFVELLSSYSGAFGFFQRQHQAAARIIGWGENNSLKEKLIPKLATGKLTSAVSFSHLRDPNHKAITAKRTKDGIELSGSVFWISGYKLLDHLVIGYACPEENKEGFAWTRFKAKRSLKVGDPLETIALDSLCTVNATFKNHFIPKEHIILEHPHATFAKRANGYPRHFASLSGLCMGMNQDLKAHGCSELAEENRLDLEERWEILRENFLFRKEKAKVERYFAEITHLTADFVELGRLVLGSRSLLVPNFVERRMREQLAFSTIPLKKDLKELLLARNLN